jgi:hypothetical protein
VHADERFRGLAGLLGQLEQLYLARLPRAWSLTQAGV